MDGGVHLHQFAKASAAGTPAAVGVAAVAWLPQTFLDEPAAERLAVLNQRTGVWRCRKIFNCTDACPREIRITEAIAAVQREILFRAVSS